MPGSPKRKPSPNTCPLCHKRLLRGLQEKVGPSWYHARCLWEWRKKEAR